MSDKSVPNEPDVRVPLFGRWRRAYFVVLIAFAFEVAFFYFVSRFFS